MTNLIIIKDFSWSELAIKTREKHPDYTCIEPGDYIGLIPPRLYNLLQQQQVIEDSFIWCLDTVQYVLEEDISCIVSGIGNKPEDIDKYLKMASTLHNVKTTVTPKESALIAIMRSLATFKKVL